MKRKSLEVTFDGFTLDNPLMPASGPLVGDLEKLTYMSNEGVGAVVTKTISMKAAKVPRPCIYAGKDYIMNSELWSEYDLTYWLEHILPNYKKKKGQPLFISMGYTKEDMVKLVPALEAFADGFEVSTHYVGKDLLVIQEVVKTIRGCTNKPLYMKVSPHIPDKVAFAKVVKEAGATGIVAINSLGPTLNVNLEHQSVDYGGKDGYVWMSGPVVKPLGLAAVYEIKSALPDFTVIGVGGIASAEDVLAYMMAGADSVQMLSGALLKGKDLYRKIIEDLPKVMGHYGVNSLQELQSLKLNQKLNHQVSYERTVPYIDLEVCIECGLCEKICPYFAIDWQKETVINSSKCFGCHLCVSRCPVKAIKV